MAIKRIKTCARKNATHYVDCSDSISSYVETLINNNAKQHFIKIFTSNSVNSKRGSIFNMDDDNLGVTDEVGRIITIHKWKKLCKHLNLYNMQIVKDFYSNMVNTSQKRLEVIVRGTMV